MQKSEAISFGYSELPCASGLRVQSMSLCRRYVDAETALKSHSTTHSQHMIHGVPMFHGAAPACLRQGRYLRSLSIVISCYVAS